MIEYCGMGFLTCENVYEPAEDTFLLANNLMIEESDYVLEIGTGTGLIAIKASKMADKVIAVDINPYAVECAQKNAEINGVSLDVRHGDLFEPVEHEKFDLIVFNTPYLPTEAEELVDEELEAAWNGGREGRDVIDRFIDQLSEHLKPNSTVQLVQSSLSDIDLTLQKLKKMGFEASVTASVRFFFEEVAVITASSH